VIVLNWKDKRGYTLVELVISMAILAIVGGAITLLMQSGSRSYSNTKAELDLQMESQTLMAQLSTMIMESNCVYYDDANKALVLYQIKTLKMPKATVSVSGGSKSKYEEIKVVKDQKLIKFRNGKLYLEEHDAMTAVPPTGSALSYKPEELFADYMNSFKADIDGSKVTVSFEMKSGKKTYKIDETTKIRNGLVVYP
jgi:prepilin-type N-terminal cleavage/methylation domain-containing protein